MQHPEHRISSPKKSITSERMAALVLGGVIPAIFIWALMAGLIANISVPNIRDIVTTIIPKKVVRENPPPGPVVPTHIAVPGDPTPPPLPNDNPGDHTIQFPPGAGGGNPWAGPPDHGALSIASTHSIPPYPPLAIRMEEQGTVTLRLEISAEGRVTNATVENSSGSARLDQAAVSWVIGNWRYQPATRDGVAVPTTAEAMVKFDLRNAMR